MREPFPRWARGLEAIVVVVLLIGFSFGITIALMRSAEDAWKDYWLGRSGTANEF